MSKTNIEWTDKVWNPTIGCAKVSAGCKNCYAEKMSIRVNAMAEARGDNDLWAAYSEILKFDYSVIDIGKAKGFNGKIKLMHDRLNQPLKWGKPAMIFVNSMSDLFHPDVPFEFIEEVFSIMAVTDRHTYQILTKRPDRMLEFIKTSEYMQGVETIKNIWLGVSVENRLSLKRTEILQEIPAAVRFISFEPLLEDIDLLFEAEDRGIDLNKIHWAILGCESGHNKRECKTEWIGNLVADLQGWEIPTFVKQLNINGKVEKDIENFPDHLQIREYPI